MQIRKSEAYRSNRPTFSRWFIHIFLILRYRIIVTFYSESKLHNVNFTHLLFLKQHDHVSTFTIDFIVHIQNIESLR